MKKDGQPIVDYMWECYSDHALSHENPTIYIRNKVSFYVGAEQMLAFMKGLLVGDGSDDTKSAILNNIGEEIFTFLKEQARKDGMN